MTVLIRILVGILLIAHGLIHLLYLTPEADDPRYPFTLRSSWLVPEPARRPVAWILMIVTVAAFTLLALAVWGVPGVSSIWPGIAIVASAASLALLIAFWSVRLSIGVAIDVAVIVLALIRPEWTERVIG